MKPQSHIRQAVIDTNEMFALVQARMMELEIGQDHPHYAELMATHMRAICEMLKLPLTSTTEPATHCHPLPRSPDRKALSLRVIAADDFTPVPDVDVSLTWVGSGCDGGSHSGTAVTDKDGVVDIPDGFLTGPAQVYLTPSMGSRFRRTSFCEAKNMLTGRPDGTYYPSVFRIEVAQSDDRDFKDHLSKQPVPQKSIRPDGR